MIYISIATLLNLVILHMVRRQVLALAEGHEQQKRLNAAMASAIDQTDCPIVGEQAAKMQLLPTKESGRIMGHVMTCNDCRNRIKNRAARVRARYPDHNWPKVMEDAGKVLQR